MGLKVLLVDDEAVFTDLIGEQLTRRGFSVAKAANGYEALARVKASPPDVILLDVLMPGITGMEVLRSLKLDPETKAIPVIICSISMRDRASKHELLQMGAKDYVSKPCEPDRLADTIKKAVGE